MTRIVGGVAGGRRLAMPRGTATRPTSERVREALFSALEAIHARETGDALAGLAFLDLYAGSGAVGLEAASRGASRVTLVEHDARALRTLRDNVADMRLPGTEVQPVDVMRFLAGTATPYDVVFLDPPYADPVDAVLELLVSAAAPVAWLSDEATVVVERATRDQPPTWPAGLVADRSRRYGDTTLWYGRRS
jgi:16S rRNA (guanine966-N2)-methyltransferase